jgi:hypothetical protein
MAPAPSTILLATLLAFGVIVDAYAQSGAASGQNTGIGTGLGGTAITGTAVRTGRGPLSQSIPPASSILNSQQNSRQNFQRPLNTPGPVHTNPPQQPFGSR